MINQNLILSMFPYRALENNRVIRTPSPYFVPRGHRRLIGQALLPPNFSLTHASTFSSIWGRYNHTICLGSVALSSNHRSSLDSSACCSSGNRLLFRRRVSSSNSSTRAWWSPCQKSSASAHRSFADNKRCSSRSRATSRPSDSTSLNACNAPWPIIGGTAWAASPRMTTRRCVGDAQRARRGSARNGQMLRVEGSRSMPPMADRVMSG